MDNSKAKKTTKKIVPFRNEISHLDGLWYHTAASCVLPDPAALLSFHHNCGISAPCFSMARAIISYASSRGRGQKRASFIGRGDLEKQVWDDVRRRVTSPLFLPPGCPSFFRFT